MNTMADLLSALIIISVTFGIPAAVTITVVKLVKGGSR